MGCQGERSYRSDSIELSTEDMAAKLREYDRLRKWHMLEPVRMTYHRLTARQNLPVVRLDIPVHRVTDLPT